MSKTSMWQTVFASFGILIIALGVFSASSADEPASQRKIVIELPLDLQPTQQRNWSEEVAAFAERLKKVYRLKDERAHKFAAWILDASDYYPVSADLLAALIRQESDFRYVATSPIGAVGPGQIMAKWWGDVCTGDLLNPSDNIRCAALVLHHYQSRYCSAEDYTCALRYYNVGPRNLLRSKAYRDAGLRYVKGVEGHLALLASYDMNNNELMETRVAQL